MKYIILIIFLLPLTAVAQKAPCKTAYIHAYQMLDSLPVPADVQIRLDSMKKATDAIISKKKTNYEKTYKSPRTVNEKLKKDKSNWADSTAKFRQKLLQKVYVKKIQDATLVIYDKGKGYESVFNADSPIFGGKIPPNTCDVTDVAIKLVRQMK